MRDRTRTANPICVPAVQRGRTEEGTAPALSFLLSLAASLCALALSAGSAPAAEEQIGGRFVSVPPTITSEAIKRIHQTIEAEYKDFTRAAPQGRRPDARAIREFRIVF